MSSGYQRANDRQDLLAEEAWRPVGSESICFGLMMNTTDAELRWEDAGLAASAWPNWPTSDA